MGKITFGQLVRELRIKRGMELAEFAQKVRVVGLSTISRFERGEIKISESTGMRMIDELSPDDATRARLHSALKAHLSAVQIAMEIVVDDEESIEEKDDDLLN